MIFFDYEKIYLLSYGKADLIIQYLRYMKENPEATTAIRGNSFILNESVILDNPYGLDDRTLAEYVGILALRNYATFKLTGDTSLPMVSYPAWLPAEIVESNPLIQKFQQKLIFKEEDK